MYDTTSRIPLYGYVTCEWPPVTPAGLYRLYYREPRQRLVSELLARVSRAMNEILKVVLRYMQERENNKLRWFHRFSIAVRPVPALMSANVCTKRRHLCKALSLTQRRKRKRRAYVQGLKV